MSALVEAYKTLGDPSRVRIVHLLQQGMLNVQEITSVLELSQPTVSHHLKALQRAGFVSRQRNGTWVYFALAQTHDEGEAGTQQPYLQDRLLRSLLDILEHGGDPELPLEHDQRQLRKILDARRKSAHDFFRTHAPQWKALRSKAQFDVSFLDLIAPRIPDYGTLLELGCGSGALLEQILPRSGATIGVDPSQSMLDEARMQLGRKNLSADLRLGYGEHLPLGDNSVDIALACMVMHYVAAPLEALRELYRVMKPGATLFVVDLNQHENEDARQTFAHVWLGFDPKEFRKWLRKAGFSSIRIETIGVDQQAFCISAIR